MLTSEQAAEFVSGSLSTNDVRPFALTVVTLYACLQRTAEGWSPFLLAGHAAPRWHSPGRGGRTEPMTAEEAAVMAGLE